MFSAGRVETPGAGFGEGLARAAVAGREPGDVKPGGFEELDEPLTDHAGRAEDAYVTPFHLVRIARWRVRVSELAGWQVSDPADWPGRQSALIDVVTRRRL